MSARWCYFWRLCRKISPRTSRDLDIHATLFGLTKSIGLALRKEKRPIQKTLSELQQRADDFWNYWSFWVEFMRSTLISEFWMTGNSWQRFQILLNSRWLICWRPWCQIVFRCVSLIPYRFRSSQSVDKQAIA